MKWPADVLLNRLSSCWKFGCEGSPLNEVLINRTSEPAALHVGFLPYLRSLGREGGREGERERERERERGRRGGGQPPTRRYLLRRGEGWGRWLHDYTDRTRHSTLFTVCGPLLSTHLAVWCTMQEAQRTRKRTRKQCLGNSFLLANSGLPM